MAVLRETQWHLRQPLERFRQVQGPELGDLGDDVGTFWREADRIILRRLPHSRVIKFPADQAEEFTRWGDDLVQAAASSRPPFDVTFFDFGCVPLGDWEIVAAVVFAQPMNDLEWGAFVFERRKGQNDWAKAYVGSDNLRNMQSHKPQAGRSLILAPESNDERPDNDDPIRLARIVGGALVFLESANVDLVLAEHQPPRWHQAHGIPHHEVRVRQATRRYAYTDDHRSPTQEWSHRWEVRGHFKHFRKGPTYEANAQRRLLLPDGSDCVRIWCPPHVKGPQGKPLIPKIRVVD